MPETATADPPRPGSRPRRRGVLRRGVRVLWRGIRDEPLLFSVAVAGSAVYGAATAATGWALGRVTEEVITPALTGEATVTAADAWRAGGVLALIAVVTAVGVVVRRAGAGTTMYALQARYRRRITRQYLRLPLSWHHRHPAGRLLSNANADVEATWQVFAPLPFALGVLVMLLVAGAAMVAADWVLAVIGLLVLPAILLANLVYQRYMSPRVMLAQQLRAEVSGVAHESFDGALVVKALGRETEETERFRTEADRLRHANVAVGRMRGVFDPLIESLPTLGTLAVLLVGTIRIRSGAAGPGDVVQVAFLLTLLAFPVRAIGWVLGELPRTVVGWERLSEVLEAQGSLPFGQRRVPAHGPAELRLRGVDYAYTGPDGEEAAVLHDVTVDVAAGSTVAVVGPTGSGKSTLAGLLVRLVDPRDGRVLLDGVDLADLARGEVAGTAALVPQGTFLFEDTVRGNITLGLEEQGTVTDEDVWAALRLAQGDGFVAALPDGLDTQVGERGATLSGGQRQRIALARALVRRPRLLVLDDATSAVDPRVEAAILAGLRTSGLGTTVVVVAYRRATISLADEVIYVEQGRVAARGAHEELARTSPGYARLVTAYQRDAQERAAQRDAARAAATQEPA
ncbi:ABC transporter ATP-binding protein [Quadrisphaera sp. GCM10027208]|uniref:ABC transporter ATP-binding protein n=1 Tax=Quadrisphaera sp. GCM10027208 TaxID=3273423 RepID=UPI00361173CB